MGGNWWRLGETHDQPKIAGRPSHVQPARADLDFPAAALVGGFWAVAPRWHSHSLRHRDSLNLLYLT